MSASELAKAEAVSVHCVRRHIKNHGIEPVEIKLNRSRYARYYDATQLREIVKDFNHKSGWSAKHEKTVRKYPVADMTKKCGGCGETKPLREFKRTWAPAKDGQGHHYKCNDCRIDKQPPQPQQSFNDLARAFLRATL